MDIYANPATDLASPTKARRKLSIPKDLYRVNPWVFVLKLGAFGAIMVLCIGIVLVSHPIIALIAQFVLGLMYAHAVELQHQCLHGTALRGKHANRIVGFLLGLPMLNCYSHYRAKHLKHHSLLGTPEDEEFFDYDRSYLGSWRALLLRAYKMNRYKNVLTNIYRSVRNGKFPDARNPKEERHIRQEYLLIGALLLLALGASIYFHTVLLIWLWIIPLVISAEAAHYLIELPEHLDCPKDTKDVLINTRSIDGNKFSFWLTNGNNYHVEHHYAPGVPVERLEAVHAMLSPYIEHKSPTYWKFYSSLITKHHAR